MTAQFVAGSLLTQPHFSKFREDGWPLCPECGQDELFSYLRWDTDQPPPLLEEFLKDGLLCCNCAWCIILLPGAAEPEAEP